VSVVTREETAVLARGYTISSKQSWLVARDSWLVEVASEWALVRYSFG